MAINKLNFTFACGETLSDTKLNKLITAINSTIDLISTIDDELSSLRDCCEGDPDTPTPVPQGLDGISTLLAFTGAVDDAAAQTKWNSIKNSTSYPPSGFSISSNVNLGENEALYMTSALRKGADDWLRVDGFIWSQPVRIGSGNSTSTTGTDDDNYNYIYCRTQESVNESNKGLYIGDSNTNWVNIMNKIEADTTKTKGFDKNGNQGTKGSANYWGDHPYGIDETLTKEWQVGFKKNDLGNWLYYFGPICISHWGHDGLDGDGYEYIYYLLPSSLSGNPTLNPPYSGRIGENGSTTLTNVTVNSTDYQLDDFIPTNWHDEPQQISAAYPRQYCSTRRREGAQEANNKWLAFTQPKLWSVYATNGFLITLDNDTVIFDDDTSADIVEHVSVTHAYLWDGLNNITFAGNYQKVTVTIDCASTSKYRSKLVPCTITEYRIIDSSNTKDIVVSLKGWGTEINISTYNSLGYNSDGFKGFCLSKTTLGKLEEGSESVTYTIKGYREANGTTPDLVVSRLLTLLVVDISNGEAYSLSVSPNTLGVNNDNTYRDNISTFKVSVTKASGSGADQKIEYATFKKYGDTLLNGDLYIKVTPTAVNGATVQNPNISISDKTATVSVGSCGTPVTLIYAFEVELYYQYNGTGIKVDNETVDFSVQGEQGPAGQGQGTESYVVTTINDNAVIDDQTTTPVALKEATLNPITVYKGNLNVTSLCLFTTTISLPNNLNLNTTTDSRYLNSKIYVIQPVGTISSIEPGNYYYDIDIVHDGSKRATKRFKLYVDANISPDGSFYKLSVENDTISYSGTGTVQSTDDIVIKAYKILLDGTSSQQTLYNDSSKLHVISNLNNINYYLSGGIITIAKNSISYNANGYDVTLYNGLYYADGPEHIDCIKDGKDGEGGGGGGQGPQGDPATVYEICPDPSSVKFSYDSSNNTFTPSQITLKCYVLKTVGTNTPIKMTPSGSGTIDSTYTLCYLLNWSSTGGDTGYHAFSGGGVDINSYGGSMIVSVDIYLASSWNSNGVNSYIKKITVPVVRDGIKGESGESSTGSVGKFYYYGGEWGNNPTLNTDEYKAPYIKYNNKFYMWTGTGTPTVGPGYSDLWKEIIYNEYMMTDAFFSNYAHLGAAIFNRDWMISQYGEKSGQVSSDYTSFDPIAFMTKIKGEASIGVINGNGSNNPSSLVFKVKNNGATITITGSGSASLIKFKDNDFFRFDNSSALPSGIYESTSINIPTANLNISPGTYCLVGGSISSITVKDTSYSGLFIPNYALDLRSGFVYLNNAYIKGEIRASKYYQASQIIDVKDVETKYINEGIQIVIIHSYYTNSSNSRSNNIVKLPTSPGMVVDIYSSHKSNTNSLPCRISSDWGVVDVYNNDIPSLLIKEGLKVRVYCDDDGRWRMLDGWNSSFNAILSDVLLVNKLTLNQRSIQTNETIEPYTSSVVGDIIFAPNCKTFNGNVLLSNSNSSSTADDNSGSHTFGTRRPRIFVCMGSYWKEYDCVGS